MDHVDLWITAIGSIVVLVGSTPAFIAKFPRQAVWVNWAGSIMSAGGSIFALAGARIGGHGTAASAMLVPPRLNPRDAIIRSLYAGLVGSALSTIAGVVTLAREGNSSSLGWVVTGLGVTAFARVSMTLRSGPPASSTANAESAAVSRS